MTKEQLSFMFNRVIDGFFIEPDVSIGREKRHGKKIYTVLDMRSDDIDEVEFKTIDELWEFKLNGERLGDLIEKLTELNIDGEFGGE